MPRYEVHIPAVDRTGFNFTFRVDAENWTTALKIGLKKLGEQGASGQNVLVDIQDDNSLHVTSPETGRVFQIRELTDQEASSAQEKRPEKPSREEARATAGHEARTLQEMPVLKAPLPRIDQSTVVDAPRPHFNGERHRTNTSGDQARPSGERARPLAPGQAAAGDALNETLPPVPREERPRSTSSPARPSVPARERPRPSESPSARVRPGASGERARPSDASLERARPEASGESARSPRSSGERSRADASHDVLRAPRPSGERSRGDGGAEPSRPVPNVGERPRPAPGGERVVRADASHEFARPSSPGGARTARADASHEFARPSPQSGERPKPSPERVRPGASGEHSRSPSTPERSKPLGNAPAAPEDEGLLDTLPPASPASRGVRPERSVARPRSPEVSSRGLQGSPPPRPSQSLDGPTVVHHRAPRAPGGEPFSDEGLGGVQSVVELERPTRSVGDIGRRARMTGVRDEIENLLAEVFDRMQSLGEMPSPEKALYFLLDLALEKIPAESGTFFEADPVTGALHFAAVRGPKAQEILRANLVVPAGTGVVGFCVSEGVSLALSEVQKDPRYYAAVAERFNYETHSVLCAPMVAQERTFGCLQLLNKRDTPVFDEVEVGLAAYLAHQAALYLAARADEPSRHTPRRRR